MYTIIYIVKSGRLYGDNKALLGILDELMPIKAIKPILILGEKGPLIAELEARNISYHYVPFNFSVFPPLGRSLKGYIFYLPRLLKTVLLNRNAVKRITEITKQINPTLIHTNVGPVDVGIKVAKALNLPHVWHLREYQDLDFKMDYFPSKSTFRKQLRESSAIAITKGVYDYFDLSKNVKEYYSQVIYDGVCTAKNTQPIYNGAKKYFLFVGRIEDAKGIWSVIEAISTIKKSTGNLIQLKIAGEGNPAYVQALQTYIREQGIVDQIEFLGFRRDIAALMNKAKALLVPSKYEGFGFITVEAMYNSCLVIGRNTAGTKEILEPKDLGLLFNDQAELVMHLKAVQTSEMDAYRKKINIAQDEAVSLYAKEQGAQEVLRFYKKIIDEKKR